MVGGGDPAVEGEPQTAGLEAETSWANLVLGRRRARALPDRPVGDLIDAISL